MAASITKTFTAPESGMSGSAEVRFIRSVIESGVTKYLHGITAINYNGSNTSAFDVSTIPAGSVINSVKFTSLTAKNSNASFWGSTLNKYLDITNIPELNNANILSYLRAQSTFTTVPCRFNIITRTSAQSGIYKSVNDEWDISSDGTISLYGKYYNLRLEVNYTPPDDDGTVSFGNNGTWQKCKMYQGVNGVWQKVKGYFGADGTWKQVK